MSKFGISGTIVVGIRKTKDERQMTKGIQTNHLVFRGPYSDPPPAFTFVEWAKKYGPMFTIWAGPTPIIVVNNYELNNEASIVKRNDFIERVDSIMSKFRED